MSKVKSSSVSHPEAYSYSMLQLNQIFTRGGTWARSENVQKQVLCECCTKRRYEETFTAQVKCHGVHAASTHFDASMLRWSGQRLRCLGSSSFICAAMSRSLQSQTELDLFVSFCVCCILLPHLNLKIPKVLFWYFFCLWVNHKNLSSFWFLSKGSHLVRIKCMCFEMDWRQRCLRNELFRPLAKINIQPRLWAKLNSVPSPARAWTWRAWTAPEERRSA